MIKSSKSTPVRKEVTKIMKKTFLALLGAVVCAGGLFACDGGSTNVSNENNGGFDTSKAITPYTRDTTSGTRDGFCTNLGIENAKKSDDLLTDTVGQTTGNGDMMVKVANDEYGIGYCSLSTVSENDDIKALKVNGVEANDETVVSGSYKLQRNFNMAYATQVDTNRDATKIALIQSYVAFASSTEGQTIIIGDGGIVDPNDDFAAGKSFADLVKENQGDGQWAKVLGITVNSNGSYAVATDVSKETVYFVGSTSVEDMSKDLSDAWVANFPEGNKPTANHNHTGSGDAITKLDQGTQGDIGFASRDFNSDETSGEHHETYGFAELCKDAICPIVNAANPLGDITIAQLRDIYVNPDAIKDSATSNTNFGADYSSETPITTWSQLIK